MLRGCSGMFQRCSMNGPGMLRGCSGVLRLRAPLELRAELRASSGLSLEPRAPGSGPKSRLWPCFSRINMD